MRAHANRTYLFAPGNHPRRVEKALSLDADVVILDLEDAVAVAEKVATRATVRDALTQPRNGAAFVRVNAYDTTFCYGDIAAAVCAELDGIVLPKLESVSDLKSVEWLLENLEREQGLPVGEIELMPIIETAKGVAALRDLAQTPSRVQRYAFGAADYCRDIGLEWTMEEGELLPVRSEMVLASRLGGLQAPIDSVFVHIKEHDAYAASCETVRGLGFQGKMVIHPDQIEPANRIFAPDAEKIAWAERVVAAFEEAEAAGIASIQLDGYFIDYPVVDMARRTVDLANTLKALGKL